MGRAKEEMYRDDHRRQVAIDVAIEVGLLKRCKFHDDAIFRGDNDNMVDAYKKAQVKFSSGELSDVFDSRIQMTDTIKHVVEELSVMDECPYPPCTMGDD